MTEKYGKTKQDAHFITLADFKTAFIDCTGIPIKGCFATFLKSITLKLGNLVHADCSEPINQVFEKQRQDFEAASPQVQEMATAYKEQVASSPEVKALTKGITGLSEYERLLIKQDICKSQ